MIVFNPKLHTYTESPHSNNDYIIIDNANGQHVIQHVKKIFWIVWVTDERAFPTWDACVDFVEKNKPKNS